ncbi:hypothetical protein KZ813_07270 [Sphingomonas sp. RHCKR7]|uniref:hypothetical protein n=1 Tax=Sphingomonas folli TaxID=2862497 RepID=UPI001CA542F0|nr:hypothetical protein [Sphingomonas folli]MBW6526634.1 hypothetical protein [Sphingomonas folli]
MTDHQHHDHADGHGRLRDGVDQARDKASHAYESARERASEAAHATAETLEANPLGLVVGGLALGALVAAVIPRGQRERELLAPVGKKVSAAATAAFAAAKEAGRGEIEQLGLTPDAARGQAKSLFQGVVKAATSAGAAAAKAGKDQVKTTS